MSKQDDLARVTGAVRRAIPELQGVMIASTDGLPLAHDVAEAAAETLAAMAATALGLGQRITERSGIGAMVETVVRGESGYFVVYGAGPSAVLVLSGPRDANLGLMRLEARTASAEIMRVLQ